MKKTMMSLLSRCTRQIQEQRRAKPAGSLWMKSLLDPHLTRHQTLGASLCHSPGSEASLKIIQQTTQLLPFYLSKIWSVCLEDTCVWHREAPLMLFHRSVLGSSRISSQSTVESINEEIEETLSKRDVAISFTGSLHYLPFLSHKNHHNTCPLVIVLSFVSFHYYTHGFSSIFAFKTKCWCWEFCGSFFFLLPARCAGEKRHCERTSDGGNAGRGDRYRHLWDRHSFTSGHTQHRCVSRCWWCRGYHVSRVS